ncbi:TniQ family protein [Thalassotalea ponticola]|uniref:TniQ family protein n=1 Tax=Thalassotalea ponticola TaxID=1523392 RepID=UPI0025B5E48B|nr:TniQ family protein [Thalassotalea ponticola]MDN3653431.1 TniQ family protein [Thalassotalea ponticola]
MRNHPPIRPRPQAGESVQGYVLRIAACNGFFDSKIIFQMLDLNPSETVYDVKRDRFPQFASRLAVALQLAPEDLKNHFDTTHALDKNDSTCVVKISSKKLKLCSVCIDEKDGYVKHEWQHGHITHCNEHQVMLIDSCPSCHHQLEWNSDVFAGCFRCGLRWSDYSPLPEDIPSYQRAWLQCLPLEKEAYLDALYQAGTIVLSPSRFNVTPIARWDKTVEESVNVFSKAFSLLRSADNRSRLLKQLYAALGATVQNNLINSIKRLLQHPVEQLPSLGGCAEGIAEERCNVEVCDECLLLDGQASKLLALTPAQLKELNHGLGLSSTKVKSSYRYSLIQLQEILDRLRKQSASAICEFDDDYLTLNSISNICAKYLFNFGDALALLLRENVNFHRRNDASTFADFYVSKSELIMLLAEHEESQYGRLLSTSEIMAYLGTERVKVTAIASLLGWETVPVTRSSFQYQAKDVKAFTDNYVLLDKWCDVALYGKRSLNKFLIENGFQAVDGADTPHTKLHLFNKTPELLSAIEEFEREWYKSKPPRHLKHRLQLQLQGNHLLSASSLELFKQRCAS